MLYKRILNAGLAVLMCAGLFSCEDKYPTSRPEPYDTDLFSIRIVNAGAGGNTVLEGTIDEDNKMINFPRLDIESNFSALNFVAELSDGAELQTPTMDFSMDDETYEKTQTLRIVNNKRYKEYFVRIRKRVPVFGADFEKAEVFDFSASATIYPDFSDAASTRCASYDGQHVLVVSRATQPHLLKVSDLKEGKIAPIPLDVTGISGGTFTYNMGALLNGHIYLSSLSGAQASPFKIYYYDTPESAPVVMADIPVGNIAGAGNRHGDNASYNIDKNGNGYIFFGDNAATEFLRVPVSNHKTVDIGGIRVLTSKSDATMVTNVFRVGDTDKYLWGGVRVPVTVVDESLAPVYTSSIGGEAVSPKVIEFNKERYLAVCTAGQGSASKATIALEIYDITKGETIEEALERFDTGDSRNPVFTKKLGGSGNGNALAQTDFYIEKDAAGNDAKLCVFAARTGSGFVICEFPIKQEEED